MDRVSGPRLFRDPRVGRIFHGNVDLASRVRYLAPR